MTREESIGDTKAVKESADEGETEVDEVVGKFIRRRKYYNISVELGGFISYEEMKWDWDSNCLNLIYPHFFQGK